VLYLVTGTRPAAALDLVRAWPPRSGPGLGYLTRPGGNRPPAAGWWAADNGCVIAGPGRVPVDNPRWSAAWWLAFLERNAPAAPRCLFAVLPDVVCDHSATLARSLPWASRVRELGYRTAFAFQNGSEDDPHVPWDAIDAAFLAGDDVWKLGQPAHRIAVRARGHGRWVHMGRVNSAKRLRRAAVMGCDSVDGTFLKHGPDQNLPRLQGWLDQLAAVPPLPLDPPGIAA
jgi:hypothetical protein